ncbi:uncharacterized protein LOC128092811 [Culex pipiens pallens]|uniref:uncharacterized protein LOC128092811 n=1 Tax=Culex pipiens pallens TaxID=42434 RepID=UPI0022AA8D85|nr:uncharacterized protein LOC128092811 [Culex pipiens pallens]
MELHVAASFVSSFSCEKDSYRRTKCAEINGQMGSLRRSYNINVNFTADENGLRMINAFIQTIRNEINGGRRELQQQLYQLCHRRDQIILSLRATKTPRNGYKS